MGIKRSVNSAIAEYRKKRDADFHQQLQKEREEYGRERAWEIDFRNTVSTYIEDNYNVAVDVVDIVPHRIDTRTCSVVIRQYDGGVEGTFFADVTWQWTIGGGGWSAYRLGGDKLHFQPEDFIGALSHLAPETLTEL